MRAVLALALLSSCYRNHGTADEGGETPPPQNLGAQDAGTPPDDPDAEAPEDPEDPPLDAEEVAAAVAEIGSYCDGLAEAACGALEACCPQGWTPQRHSSCFARFSDGCRSDLVPSAELLHLHVGPGGAQACATAVSASLTGCPAEVAAPELLPECLDALVSTAPTGECCRYPMRDGCLYGLGCSAADDEPCEEGATCQPLPGEGEICVGPGLCDRGLSCDEDEWVCRGPSDEGERCTSTVFPACAPGLFCDADEEVCRPKAHEGEPCAALPCVVGTTCDVEQAVCVADERSPFCATPDGWGWR